MTFTALTLAIALQGEYRCVRWTWWWDADYKTRVVKCLEWKKVVRT